jgi:hypothetical protein
VVSAVNTDELELAVILARQRVLKIQTKLHRWARDDPHRRFDDLFNLVADPAFLLGCGRGFLTARGYRAAQARPLPDRAIRDEMLIADLRTVHQQNFSGYG